MMCEVMPTITEGDSGGPPRGGGAQNGSDPEANFEQLMVNMLDERDKLLESLRETQETLIQSQTKLQGALHERDVLQRQIYAALPQVRENTTHTYIQTDRETDRQTERQTERAHCCSGPVSLQ
ncbi:unnamed protein product [Oncorhynchus mykiss]|uniref:Uncharacterized protein n=1 Tax=Oncorhynchus mykiss TaxID=8022 RepID=A0A060XUT1_ONCMY|nr:unnamed protein product [Oncorhynchus mykiss]